MEVIPYIIGLLEYIKEKIGEFKWAWKK